MKFETKTITLKDGKTAILRSPDPAEAAAMLEFMEDICSETEFLIMSSEDEPYTMEYETKFLADTVASETDMMIVCEVDGRIAGNCLISFNRRVKTRHRATVAIALRQKYWGLGIGTALFTEMIAAARDRGIYQLELDYAEGNERGRALYEKMGFQAYGEHPGGFRLPDGSMRKFINMRLVL